MSKAYHCEFPKLCSPLRLGEVTLRNRICSAPMGFPDLTEDGCLTEGAIAFYENRAKGGAAIVTVSEAAVDYENGKSHGRLINLQNSGVLAGLTNVARAISRHGAIASIELNHAGMYSDFDLLETDRQNSKACHYGASDMILPTGAVVKAMSREMIAETVGLFAKGAALVKRAGFDMLMLHAGHGWLIHQFLSPAINRRQDEYGGNSVNRARLALEILYAIRSVVGKDFPIELRISAIESAEGGICLTDAIEFAQLVESKIQLLHVSVGGEPDFGLTHPSMFSESNCNVKYAAEIRKHVSVPVATVGAISDPVDMEKIIIDGSADVVCMARALLADPELPKKVEQNRSDEIVPCMRCFMCHAERMLTQTRVCAVNPEIGREYETRYLPPALKVKKVLVAGGGCGGMQAALTAALRGHKVTLCEKTDALGGRLLCEADLPFKSAFARYIKVMQRRIELAGVELHLNTEVTSEYIQAFSPDAVLVAIGAEPILPPIEGIKNKKVILAAENKNNLANIGKKVSIIGGGLAGCELGVHLAMNEGKQVSIIERLDDVAKDANPRHRPLLLELLFKHTTVYTNLSAAAVTDDGLLCRREDGSEIEIFADTVIVAAGLRSDFNKIDAFRNTALEVSFIGDCVKPSLIRSATFRAYHAALDL